MSRDELYVPRLLLGAALGLATGVAFGFEAGGGVFILGFGLTNLASAGLSYVPTTRLGLAIRHGFAFIEPLLMVGVLWVLTTGKGIPPGMLIFSPAALVLITLPALWALTTRPTLVLASGLGALSAWMAVRLGVLADPITLTKQQVIDEDFDSLFDYLRAITQPRYFDKDVWVLEMVAIAAVTVTLVSATARSRALARNAAARRAEASGLEAHFSAPVIEAMLAPDAPRTRRVTVLDCDLVGFSAHARIMEPEAVADSLRLYHAFIEHHVFAHGGGVLKFTGDGVTALFGLVGDATERARAALACAEALSAAWPAEAYDVFGHPAPRLAIGVEHGVVTAGVVGEGSTMALLIVGPTVERAQHLQAATRTVGAGILAGEPALEAAGDEAFRSRARHIEAENAWAMGD